MSQPTNLLQQVQTYQMSELALLQNSYFFLGKSNKKFKNFENMTANLGDTVTFDLPPRFTVTNSLVANFQAADQRVQTLTVDKQASVSYSFTSQQYIFNVEDYMAKFGKSAIAELGAQIEADVASLCVTAPYRFYGDGVNQINSYEQLANALALYRNFGAPRTNTMGVLQDVAVPPIVNSGLSQFALKRNDESAMSWEVGSFSNCEWFESNLLPTHIAGTEGQVGSTLTVVSTTLDANGAVTAITFSGCNAANDASSVLVNDSFQFKDGVSGFSNMRFLTFIGHLPCNNPVQFRATATAASTGGSQVTVSISPPLQVAAVNNQNINQPIRPGMQCTVLPSHRAGVIYAGDPLFLAMPQLPDQSPYVTGNAVDPDSGASFRHYYGTVFGQNSMGTIRDCIWGKTLVPDYALKLVFTL